MRIARRYTALFTKRTYLYDLTSDSAFATVATAPIKIIITALLALLVNTAFVFLSVLNSLLQFYSGVKNKSIYLATSVDVCG